MFQELLARHKRREEVDSQIGKIFQDWQERPSIQQMQSFEKRYSLRDNDIYRAARKNAITLPDMTMVLQEIQSLLPYFRQLSDVLATEYPNTTLLFAGRDAEYLLDAYSLTQEPEEQKQTAILLPASKPLWTVEELCHMGSTFDLTIAKKFLETYGITEEDLKNGKQYVVVDTGFIGNSSGLLQELILHTYPFMWKNIEQQFLTRLVCHDKNFMTLSPQNTDDLLVFPDLSHEEYLELFPRARQAASESGIVGINRRRKIQTTNYVLATAMQMLPHYHREFDAVTEKSGQVIAVPTQKAHDNNFNSIFEADLNESVANPAAALLVQRTLIASI